MHKGKRKWLCLDCNGNTSQMKEHYYLRPSVWYAVHNSEAGMLCIGCVESRLGRKLQPVDFTDAHINNYKKNAMSDRLRSRLIG